MDLAESLAMSIRWVPGSGDSDGRAGGAAVRLRGRTVIFLDPLAGVADQVGVLAEALRGRDQIEGMYLPPEIRRTIDGDPGAGERGAGNGGNRSPPARHP